MSHAIFDTNLNDAGTLVFIIFFFFKQKTAYEMRISDWSSDVCSSDLVVVDRLPGHDQLVPARRLDRPLEVDAVAAPGAQEQRDGRADALFEGIQIGRASCRERVGQYV